MPAAGAVCPFQGEVHLYIVDEYRVFLNRGHWLSANQSHGFLLLFFIFFVCAVCKTATGTISSVKAIDNERIICQENRNSN